MKPQWVVELEAKPCECASCSFCKGLGHIWAEYDGRGRYLGKGWPDDPMSEMETCEECHGSGVSEECERCVELRNYDEDSAPVTENGEGSK